MKKAYATYLLFLFIVFLATPTAVKLLDKTADVSVVYNFAEEEKSETSVSSILDFIVSTQDFEALSEHDSQNIFSLDFYQFVVKSHHVRIPSPPPDSLA